MSSRRAWCVGTLGACLVLSLAACAGDSKDEGDEGAILVGRTFLLESAEGYAPLPDRTVRLAFAAEELQFNAGCNYYVALYSVRGGHLTLSGMMSTVMGCAAPLMTQDDWMADFLSSGPGLALDGDRLTVTGADATLFFLDREVADPDRPLTGRAWAISSLIRADGTMIGGYGYSSATVVFQPDGTMQVVSYCAEGTGQFTFATARHWGTAGGARPSRALGGHADALRRHPSLTLDLRPLTLPPRQSEFGRRH